jgi:hypothetical protein
MTIGEEEDWRKLCELVAEESDPTRLCELVDQLIQKLDARQHVLGSSRQPRSPAHEK